MDLLATSPQSVVESHLSARLKEESQFHSDAEWSSASVTSLKEFFENLPAAIATSKRLILEGSVQYGSKNDPIAKLCRQTKFSHQELEPYALFDERKNYTRNLIATDDETFTLLLLCWNPGKESPIHDHPCNACYMKVCSGEVRERRYAYSKEPGAEKSLECIHDEMYKEGEFAYITDSLGFHKVGNPTESAPAVTLHLYVPPIKVCQMWISEDSPPSKCVNCHYSEYGRVLHY